MTDQDRRPGVPFEPEEFAARVRAARAYAGLTRAQLAKRLGRSKSTVERMEKGDPAALGLTGGGPFKRLRLVNELIAATGIYPNFFIGIWGPHHGQREAGPDAPSATERFADRLSQIEEALGISPEDAAELQEGLGELAAEIDRLPGPGRGEDDSPAAGDSRGT